jgi:hypothetical protein
VRDEDAACKIFFFTEPKRPARRPHAAESRGEQRGTVENSYRKKKMRGLQVATEPTAVPVIATGAAVTVSDAALWETVSEPASVAALRPA